MSLRKQEIADRLNAWIIFNEKNKELCDWLVHMENKVAHSSDLNIEEMVEKLQKVRACSRKHLHLQDLVSDTSLPHQCLSVTRSSCFRIGSSNTYTTFFTKHLKKVIFFLFLLYTYLVLPVELNCV